MLALEQNRMRIVFCLRWPGADGCIDAWCRRKERVQLDMREGGVEAQRAVQPNRATIEQPQLAGRGLVASTRPFQGMATVVISKSRGIGE